MSQPDQLFLLNEIDQAASGDLFRSNPDRFFSLLLRLYAINRDAGWFFALLKDVSVDHLFAALRKWHRPPGVSGPTFMGCPTRSELYFSYYPFGIGLQTHFKDYPMKSLNLTSHECGDLACEGANIPAQKLLVENFRAIGPENKVFREHLAILVVEYLVQERIGQLRWQIIPPFKDETFFADPDGYRLLASQNRLAEALTFEEFSVFTALQRDSTKQEVSALKVLATRKMQAGRPKDVQVAQEAVRSSEDTFSFPGLQEELVPGCTRQLIEKHRAGQAVFDYQARFLFLATYSRVVDSEKALEEKVAELAKIRPFAKNNLFKENLTGHFEKKYHYSCATAARNGLCPHLQNRHVQDQTEVSEAILRCFPAAMDRQKKKRDGGDLKYSAIHSYGSHIYLAMRLRFQQR